MSNKLLFIGRLDSDSEKGRDGVCIKNRVFYSAMQSILNKTTSIDLDKVRQPLTLMKLLMEVLRHRHNTIVFASGGSTGSCKMVSVIQKLTPPQTVVILGLGGNMHHYVLSNDSNVRVMQKCRAILAEGKEMTRVLTERGISNVYYVPNFKEISFLPQKSKRDYKKIKFLFFARITPFKGVNLIFEAIDRLRSEGYADRIEIHFYGMMLEEYKTEFEERVEKNIDLAFYHGAINGTSKETYNELAQYDVMLFPTYWNDEGFPASLVDAFIAGLPVIASDWNQNKEIIKEGENGFLIPAHDSNALAEKMKYMILNPDFIDSKANLIQQDALNYDTNHVLNLDFLRQIGLC